MEKDVESKLIKIEQALKGSKPDRFLYNPAGYLSMIFAKHVLNHISRNGYRHCIKTIFQFDYHIRLPSNAEFLTFKCKAGLSDIRLIRYLLQNLKPDDTFLDIGAKYGFYSLLAATRIGTSGKIIAIEPTSDSFKILKLNTGDYSQISSFNVLASDDNNEYWIYEFQTKYTEYNTIHLDPFLSNSNWYRAKTPLKRKVTGVILDQLISEHQWVPDIIKIDAENSDFKVLKGLQKTLTSIYPVFILRLWNDHRNNQNQRAAIAHLLSHNYNLYGLNEDGSLFPLREEELHEYPFEDIIMKSSLKQ